MKKILFLCTGNSARSIISECLLNHMGGNKFNAYSAGSKPTGKVNTYAIQTLIKNNVNYSYVSSKSWDAFVNNSFDCVVTVCNNAANESCPIYPGSPKKLHWDLKDPAAFEGSKEEILKEFQKTFDLIKKYIEQDFLHKL
jgi:arsenate reductase (thioredoxin)